MRKRERDVMSQSLTAAAPLLTQPAQRGRDVLSLRSALLEQPNATIVVPGDRHWGIFESVCQQSRSIGNTANDAWFAALAIEFGCEWITTDRDYARFEGLAWRVLF
jgi:predicted nucleic acid-binding protein